MATGIATSLATPTVPTVILALALVTPLPAQRDGTSHSNDRPNYKLAEKFSSTRVRKFLYSTSVRPSWIGKTERFHYSYKTSQGTRYWLVDGKARSKRPLFDHEQLAAALSAATQKPVTAHTLSLGTLKVDDDVTKLGFSSEGRQYEFDLKSGTLTDKGPARRGQGVVGRGPGGSLTQEQRRDLFRQWQRDGLTRDQMRQRFEQMQRRQEDNRGRRDGERGRRGGQRRRGGTGQGTRDGGAGGRDYRNFAPDKSAYVYVQRHDLYYVEGTQVPLEDDDGKKSAGNDKSGDGKGNGTAKTDDDDKAGAKPKMKWVYDEKKAIQLTKDGAEQYTFSSRSRFGSRGRRTRSSTRNETPPADPNRKTRPSATWSKNSKSFYVTRRDGRGVQELFLVDSIADPRPKLEKYAYPMPGEEKVRRSELYVFNREHKKLHRIEPRWKDESYIDVQWLGDSHELRFVRRDRLQRNIELCSVDPVAETGKSLFKEGFKSANLSPQRIRYLEKRDQFVWWSERSGWGHFYLHDTKTGKLLNAITGGSFRAGRIVAVDEDKGQMWFQANGGEPNESPYHTHLYRVDLDGTGLVCLDKGDATHSSTLSPSRRFVVDNCSRIDMAPRSILRDSNGTELMTLEETDLSKLAEMGWRMPERFVVKAADGVTDLYGNMWKPFDFDPEKRYPIIAHVYPGPQQEGVSHNFAASGSRQQLAQLGFIVIQVGHRGGAPTRSKEYAAYGYFNLRDYGLADKKAAIEQLADQHPYVDIDRVGIYGHSGGGFMTAAALMKPPYNDFFKVGVASAGNHDNNIYNNNWSERYHGLKEVEVEERTRGGNRDGNRGGTRGRERARRERGGIGEPRFLRIDDPQDQDEKTQDNTQDKKKETGNETKTGQGGKKQDDKKNDEEKQDNKKQDIKKQDIKKQDDKKQDDKKTETEKKTKFEIKVPTNAELAENLEGHLLLVHGEIDNNVHPANTMRLVDALIKANKRFDLLIIPGARHGFGRANTYFQHRMWEFFAEHLLGHTEKGADILEKGR